MAATKIEWADFSFNPWRGCTKVSDGCRNCYAERLSHRNPGVLGVWGDNGTRVVAAENYWREPLRWDRKASKLGVRYRVFCASLADVFEDREDLIETRRWLFRLIDQTNNLDWLLLTKRPENIPKMMPPWEWHGGLTGRHNVWLGTSVENQETADKRIPELLKCRSLAPVLFLSCEPLLGPVDLAKSCPPDWDRFEEKTAGMEGWEEPEEFIEECEQECDWVNYGNDLVYSREHEEWEQDREGYAKRLAVSNIDWVIVGGESGPNARPMHPDWVRSIRDQCNSAGVPFFFKQHGEWIGMPDYSVHTHGMDINKWPCRLLFPNGVDVDMVPNDDRRKYAQSHGLPTMVMRVGKTAAGRVLDGRTWDEIPGSE